MCAEARKINERLHGTIAEIKINTLICQEKFTKFNDSYITIYIISKIQAHYFRSSLQIRSAKLEYL